MENLDDEEIQRLTEDQLKAYRLKDAQEKDDDAALDRVLFAELEKNPLQNAKSELADKVVSKSELQLDKTDRLCLAVFIFALLLLFSALVFGAFVSANDALSSQVAHFFKANKSICFFVILAFCAIQFIDKYLLKKKFPTNS